MPSLRRFLVLVLPAFALIALALPPRAHAIDRLVWRGDQTTGRSVMQDMAAAYGKEKRGNIVLEPFSTISGLDAVAQGKADLAGSARGKDPNRAEEADLEFIPAALDAAVMITHARNPVASLNIHQVYEIYFGRITNWKELGGEDKPINLYASAAPLDGLEYSLRELVFKNGAKRVAAPRLYLNTASLEQAIVIDPAGIGLSSLSGVQANAGVRMIPIEGVMPSMASVRDGSYPLFIMLYLVQQREPANRGAIARFREFGQMPAALDILRRHHLVPVSEVADYDALHANRLAFIETRLKSEREAAQAAKAAAAAAELAAGGAAAPAAEAAGSAGPATPAPAPPRGAGSAAGSTAGH